MEVRFAGVLVSLRGRVLLVREAHPRLDGEVWSIPSGRVEAGESPGQGAVRELFEETGLSVAVGDLRLQTTSAVAMDGTPVHAWNYTVEVEGEPVLEVRDTDNLIREARWFSRGDAVELMTVHPWWPLAEPVQAMLTGAVPPGTHWSYGDPASIPGVTAITAD